MSGVLEIINCGPGLALQDRGRPGYLAQGLGRGGAMDQLALAEGAAILGNSPDIAALELTGMGGQFIANVPVTAVLTGAAMQVSIDDAVQPSQTSFTLNPGQNLTIGPAKAGTYGYLHIAGGFDIAPQLGAQGAHINARLGQVYQPGDKIPLTPRAATPGLTLVSEPRLTGGQVHAVRSLQTDLFAVDLDRFLTTTFIRDPRGNRQGIRLACPDEGFAAAGATQVLSEVIVPGDIQVTGDGDPYILMSECQTTGGYPRIATIIPSDLPRIAQAPIGAEVQIVLVSMEEALLRERTYREHLQALPGQVAPRLRDPADMSDLLSYQLIGGVTAGTTELEDEE